AGVFAPLGGCAAVTDGLAFVVALDDVPVTACRCVHGLRLAPTSVADTERCGDAGPRRVRGAARTRAGPGPGPADASCGCPRVDRARRAVTRGAARTRPADAAPEQFRENEGFRCGS